MNRKRSVSAFPALLLVLASGLGPAVAAPPGEVTGDRIDPTSQLTWTAVTGADDYNIYRGDITWLRSRTGAECHGDGIVGTSFATPLPPAVGRGYFYLITAESSLNGEGTPGSDTSGTVRPLRGSCDRVMRHHYLDRLGYGWDEWTRDRFATLGRQGYIDEQLNPASIDESTNTELATRTSSL